MMKVLSPASKLCSGHYILDIEYNGSCAPGQFVSVKYGATTDPLIKRPFSIFDHSNGKIEVIFKDNGKVTSLMKDTTDLSLLSISGPYGKGFTLLENKEVLLIGGGVGNAPLHFLGKSLRANGCSTTFIYAARSEEYIYCHDRFCTGMNEISYITDDGSFGSKGYAADLIRKAAEGKNIAMAYVCGPTVMMKACAEELLKLNIPFEVSLENYFGCGIGICSGCSVDTTDGKKRACVDGPVFNGKDLIFNLL